MALSSFYGPFLVPFVIIMIMYFSGSMVSDDNDFKTARAVCLGLGQKICTRDGVLVKLMSANQFTFKFDVIYPIRNSEKGILSSFSSRSISSRRS